jgi:histidine ammonia-lyase
MPASAETATTGAGKEDHVSMGGFAARKALQVNKRLYFVIFC